MKPFNLEEYLANPSRKVVTRDGRAITRILCTDAKGDYPVFALIERTDGSEYALSYTKDGKYINETTDNNDLFFAPEKHEGWVNIYRDTILSVMPFYKYIHPSEEEAKRNACLGVTATVKIEWEE